jgi:hypothetical protein
MQRRLTHLMFCSFMVFTPQGRSEQSQILMGHVPQGVSKLQPIGRLEASNRLDLAIALPLHDRADLTNLLHQVYAPRSPMFRRFLNPAEFTRLFGPTEQEYQKVIDFAKSKGLSLRATHANRLLVDVSGDVPTVEAAFKVNLRLYPQPEYSRTFFAPDTEPLVDKGLPILHISGLDNKTLPRARSKRLPDGQSQGDTARVGSGPNGSYLGNDFRAAYVPNLSLTGTGQSVGLLEFGGYYAADIANYEAQAGIQDVPLVNVLIDGFNGAATGHRSGSNNEEVALDIEVVASMAPGVSEILVYEAAPTATTATIDDLLNRMATDNLAAQLSCSWGFDIDSTAQQIFEQLAAQGQSFFVAAGDNGAYGSFVDQPSDDPYLTVVGGTSLNTDSAHHWLSETTWSGSGGGISSVYAIPEWQRGIDMSLNHGSTLMRNLPDVAMLADDVWEWADDGQSFAVVGTSIAAPLWAAFTALVNQQGAANGQPRVGFLNPALYAIGNSPGYHQSFHDITTGNNTSTNSPNLFFAVTGYDLCTGWGSPNGGTSLINALLAPPVEPLLVTSPLGFIAQGPVGGPFTISSQTYTLTNLGNAPLSWSLVNTSAWLDVSLASGVLNPGDPAAAINISIDPSANNFLIGNFLGTVLFSIAADGVTQDRTFVLQVGNGGFETGDFSDWSFSGNSTYNFADSVDSTDLFGSTLPDVNDSLFVHSGIYGAFLGEIGSLGFLSQSLPTLPGQRYIFSFWLDNPAAGTPNEFSVSWDGMNLFDNINLSKFAWTNMQFIVTASTANTSLQFGFRNDNDGFGLDDITVQLLPTAPPDLQIALQPDGTILLTWSAVPGQVYQVQFTDDLLSSQWSNLGDSTTATSSAMSISTSTVASSQRFFRIMTP